MRLRLQILVSALALLVFVTSASADEVPLLDGHTFKGKIEEITDNGVKLKMNLKSGGTVVTTISANNVDPHWWYKLQDGRAGDDVKKHLALAVWAVEHGLFRQGKAQLERARALDAAETNKWMQDVVPGMRDGIAHDLVRSAHRAMDDGDLNDARKMVHAVIKRLGDTPAADEARALLPKLQERIDRKLRHAASRQAFMKREADREKADKRKAVMDPMVALVEQGNHILAQGGTAVEKSSSLAHDRQAAVEFRKAVPQIDERIKNHADDALLVEKLEALRAEAVKGFIQTSVNQADIYLARGDFDDAKKQAKTLAAVAPDAPETHEIEQRVAEEEQWSQGEGNVDGGFYSGRWYARRGFGRPSGAARRR